MLFVVHLLVATILLNLLISNLAAYFATPEEKNPPQGVTNLSYKGQAMNLLVHHAYIPMTSTVVTFLMVFFAFRLAQYFKTLDR
jgi:hypothetical protein